MPVGGFIVSFLVDFLLSTVVLKSADMDLHLANFLQATTPNLITKLL